MRNDIKAHKCRDTNDINSVASLVASDVLWEYKVVTAHCPVDFEQKVNQSIKDGFEPFGAPIATGRCMDKLMQAMVCKVSVITKKDRTWEK